MHAASNVLLTQAELLCGAAVHQFPSEDVRKALGARIELTEQQVQVIRPFTSRWPLWLSSDWSGMAF